VIKPAKSKRNSSTKVADIGIDEVPDTDLYLVESSRTVKGSDRPSATAGVIELGQGLYALDIGELGSAQGLLSGLRLPMAQISVTSFAGQGDRVEIVGSAGTGTWFGPEGGTAIVKSSSSGHVLLTAYGPPAKPVALPTVEIRRLDRSPPVGAQLRSVEPAAPPQEVQTEIVLHIERTGDRRFPGHGWVGNRGRKLRVEAFSIRPLDILRARDIEFKALGPNRRQTPWVTDAKLAGTRGQGLPLTGFAVRLSADAGERFDVVYEGAFFESGIVGPNRNGELCFPPIADDPLEAINLRIVPRLGR
jgi:hypothetical protein